MSEKNEQRDRIRSLVKEILDGVPADLVKAGEYPVRVPVYSLTEQSEKQYDRDESAKSLLTEGDFRGLEDGSRIRIAENAKLTPLAADIVKEMNLVLVKKEPRDASLKVSSVGIGSDHGGFDVKRQLISYLGDLGLKVRDFGTDSAEAADYPDFAHLVGEAVSNGTVDVGIVIDGAGIGSAMAAGKVPGVRPAACYNPALARNSRQHNGANVLTLGSGQNSIDQIKEIVSAFLMHEITEPRHKRRVDKIDAIERQYRK